MLWRVCHFCGIQVTKFLVVPIDGRSNSLNVSLSAAIILNTSAMPAFSTRTTFAVDYSPDERSLTESLGVTCSAFFIVTLTLVTLGKQPNKINHNFQLNSFKLNLKD
jgi:hypothetical protein